MTETEFLAMLAGVRPHLWRHAKRILHTRATTPADLVQSASLYLWRVRERLAAYPNPAGAFVTAGRRHMLRHLKQSKAMTTCDPETLADSVATSDPEPDEFDALVGLLPLPAGELVWRRFADGCEYSELARPLGITADAARKRVEHALAHLRERLAW